MNKDMINAERLDSAIYLEKLPAKNKTPAIIAEELCKLNTTNELIEYYGYPCQSHIATTSDAWQLTLFRIPYSNKSLVPKKSMPIILWHGLSTSSAIWTCNVGAENNLAFFLSEQGYDIWLGNNRGTVYTKHLRYQSSQHEYWDFSLDDLVEDVKGTVDYILNVTGAPKVGYIGFSQGTAQMFAALADCPELNSKIAYFAALAPAIRPRPFGCYPLRALTNITPNIMQSIFGRRSFLPITNSVRNSVPSGVFETLISNSMRALFNWNNALFEKTHQKALYSHVFGVSSTKVMNHWFQVMQNGFAKYNNCQCLRLRSRVRYTLVQFVAQWVPLKTLTQKPPCCIQKKSEMHYKTWTITAPIGLYYGGNDLMTDIDYISSTVSGIVTKTCLPDYDHMDFVWSKTVRSNVWIPLLQDLSKYCDGNISV